MSWLIALFRWRFFIDDLILFISTFLLGLVRAYCVLEYNLLE